MQPENWKKVKELLNDVLPLTTIERGKFFEQNKISGEICREVESLLLFEKESEDLMNLSAVDFLKDFIDADENTLVGQDIGVYKIMRELGYGGMGAVYLAERTDGKFEQKVALKLLKREMNTAALRRRFSQEREILASLQHPNIAGLLNAGTTDDKIPYIAMEYVEGVPIDEYCSKHSFDLNQRLELFREICSTVDFAHRNLIVHRDLKPSNILVTNDGVPKLLDFGISKILSTELEQLNSATITKLGVMTPSYASPEQLRNESVTTATDIYSLGVILYELLSGHRPFESKESDIKEIYKAVMEIEPPLPSSMAETVSRQFKEITEAKTVIKAGEKSDISDSTINRKDSATDAAKMRRTNPQTVNLNSQSLRGDLDNIILKALRKEPERRYSSAENFSEDIKRHLKGLPVTARPNTFSYRAEKFIKRNKASVVAGVLIFLAIIGGIVATLWQARVAQAERAKAERRFNDVRQLANSFLFNLSPKIERLPGSTPARVELVNLALEYLDSLSQEAGDDLELQRELAAAYEKVGDVQGHPVTPNIGDLKGATASYEKAQAIRRRLLEIEPDNFEEQSRLANNLEVLSKINVYGGDSSKTEPNAAEAVALREKLVERDPQNFEARYGLAKALQSAGAVPFYQKKFADSLPYYKRANEIIETLHQERPDDYKTEAELANSRIFVAEVMDWMGDSVAAGDKFRNGIEILIPLVENNPNDTKIRRDLMQGYLKLAENYLGLEDKPNALINYDKSLEMARKTLENDPRNYTAKRDQIQVITYRAKALAPKQLIADYEKAIVIQKELQADDPGNNIINYDLALTYFEMGRAYQSLENYSVAIETYEKTIEYGKTFLKNDAGHYISRVIIAVSLRKQSESYAAIAKQNNQIEMWKKTLEKARASLAQYDELKKDGKFTDTDKPSVEAAEKLIAESEAKLK